MTPTASEPIIDMKQNENPKRVAAGKNLVVKLQFGGKKEKKFLWTANKVSTELKFLRFQLISVSESAYRIVGWSIFHME